MCPYFLEFQGGQIFKVLHLPHHHLGCTSCAFSNALGLLVSQFLHIFVVDEISETLDDALNGSELVDHLLMVASALIGGSCLDDAAQPAMNPSGLLFLDAEFEVSSVFNEVVHVFPLLGILPVRPLLPVFGLFHKIRSAIGGFS
jgi:hypothetical protein